MEILNKEIVTLAREVGMPSKNGKSTYTDIELFLLTKKLTMTVKPYKKLGSADTFFEFSLYEIGVDYVNKIRGKGNYNNYIEAKDEVIILAFRKLVWKV